MQEMRKIAVENEKLKQMSVTLLLESESTSTVVK